MIEVKKNAFAAAVKEFWRIREAQANAQIGRGVSDQGSRSAVTGGRQLDGFIKVLTRIITGAGIPLSNVFSGNRLADLPGYFRPEKGWDLVVTDDENLLAVIELKSQVGPSFGNNFNNRTEEALGSAVDLWTAYREGVFRQSTSPWLGYLFLLEDCTRSRIPVKVRESHFNVLPEYKSASYAMRYELFCRKLLLERHYNSVCFLVSDKTKVNARVNYYEPAPDLGAERFFSQLIRHIRPAK